MRLRTLLAAAAVVTLAPACATIMHGSKQEVTFASTPTGARVMVDGQNVGVTPAAVSLSRKDRHNVRIELDGYQASELILNRSLDGWVWGNIIFGGLPGLVVDAVTGSMYKLSPSEVNATLAQQSGSLLRDGRDGLYIAVVMEADPSWEQIGQLVRE